MYKKEFIVKLSYQDKSKILFLAFPFSGATAQFFQIWKKYIPHYIDLFAIQYPGRGHLIHEKPLTDIKLLLLLLYKPLLNTIKQYKCVICYGHSLGGLIAYELLKEYLSAEVDMPTIQLVVGACPSPNLIGKKPHLHNLADDEFWVKIKQYGGTPDAIINDDAFKDLFLPILKADFTMYENYIFNHNKKVLDVPLIAVGGKDDKVVQYSELNGWKDLTSNTYTQICVEGNHFFLNYNPPVLLDMILKQFLLVIA